jgi:hypothetical protein
MMRKISLALSIGAALLLSACSTTTSTTGSSVTPAQVITDLDQAGNTIMGILPQLVALPGGLTQAQATTIQDDVAEAQAALATVSASTALTTSLPIMQRVFGGLNTAVTIIEAVPMPSQDKTIVVATGVVLQGVEAYLNSTMPAPPPVSAPPPSTAAVNSARAVISNGGHPTR